MGTSRIEQIIEDIYDFVESCKPQAFSSSKVIVPKDELYDLLDELKLRTPDEIKRYQKIISNRDSILADAEKKSQAILEEARLKTDDMINESDIMQQAYERANAIVVQAEEEAGRILQSAGEDANQIRTGALSYAEEMLGEVEKVVSHTYESAKSRCDSLMDTLRGNLEVLTANRNEIVTELYGTPSPEPVEEPEPGGEAAAGQLPEDEENYEFDVDTFLNDIK